MKYIIYIVIIIYINLVVFNFSNLKLKKKLELSLLEFDFKNLIQVMLYIIVILIVDLKFGNFLGLNILIVYFCNTCLSISLRHLFCNLYYKYMVLFSLQKTKNLIWLKKIFNLDSKITEIIFHNYFRSLVYHIAICCVSVKLWLLYWLLMEYYEFFSLSLKDQFDKAMFNKSQGQDIVLTSNGIFKLNIYIKVLLCKKKNIYHEFELAFDFDEFEIFYPCLEHGEDFNYTDPVIESLAKIECF